MTNQLPPAPTLSYPWQRGQWEQLEALIDSERMPHAILLSGVEHLGKLQFANALAQRLICEMPVAGHGCGECKQCRLVAAETHPDLIQLQPDEPGKAIRIDPVREVGEFVAKTAQQSGWKVVVIHPAEAMNANAANALLKSLEEPGANTLLILVCHELSRLPATIRSRCRIIKFPVPAEDMVRPWLSGIVGQQEDLDKLLGFSDGRPLLALKLLETDLLEQRLAFDELLNAVAERRISPLVAADQCQQPGSLVVLDWLQNRVSEYLRQPSPPVSARLLFRYLDRLVICKRRLQSTANPNQQLLWEELLMDWQLLFNARS